MRRGYAAGLVAGALLLASLSTASASSVAANAAVLTTASGQACTASTIKVTRTDPQYFLWFILIGYEGVRLSGVPESCWNLPIQITAGGGPADGAAPNGATSGTLDIAMDYYGRNVSSFPLVIDGWHVPTSV